MNAAAAEIWHQIIEDGRYAAMKPAALRVYGYLLDQFTPGVRFEIFTGTLAARVGLSCRHTNRALRTLTASGLIQRIRRPQDAETLGVLYVIPAPQVQKVLSSLPA
jgi:DNA-binding MarR family transcriptional regulator